MWKGNPERHKLERTMTKPNFTARFVQSISNKMGKM